LLAFFSAGLFLRPGPAYLHSRRVWKAHLRPIPGLLDQRGRLDAAPFI